MTEFFISRGCSIDAVNKFYMTPLLSAVVNTGIIGISNPIIKIFLQENCDMEYAGDLDSEDYFTYGLNNKDISDIIQGKFELSYNVNWRYLTPCTLATAMGYLSAIAMLITAGAIYYRKHVEIILSKLTVSTMSNSGL